MQEETISLALLVVANAGNCRLLWGRRGLVEGFGFGSPTERCSKDLWSSAYSRPKDSSASGSSSRPESPTSGVLAWGSCLELTASFDTQLVFFTSLCFRAHFHLPESSLTSEFQDLHPPSENQPEAAIVKQNRSGLVKSSAPATRSLGDKTQP